MGIITDNSTEEEQQQMCDGVRSIIMADANPENLHDFLTDQGQQTSVQLLETYLQGIKRDRLIFSEWVGKNDKSQTQGQHHLELDETALKSTGKSVEIDEVIAKIDELTTDK